MPIDGSERPMTGVGGDRRDLLTKTVVFAGAVLAAGLAFNLVEYGELKSLVVARAMYTSRNLAYALVYLGTYAVAAAALVVALFSRSTVARWSALATVFVFVAIDVSCRQVTGENIGFTQVHMAFAERSFAGEFVRSYAGSVLKATLIAGATAGALLAAVHWVRLRFAARWLGLVPLAAVLIYGVLWKTVAFTDVYPSPLRVPVLVAYASMNSLYVGPRRPVEMTAGGETRPRALILIMDESIRGDFLGINDSTRDTTPFLRSVSDRFLNFGVACAASNISSGTNAILRAGLRVDQVPDRAQLALKNPSIFQYAKAAGYRTCFLDGQYAPGELSNFMTGRDVDGIDEAYWVTAEEEESTDRSQRDALLAQRILELLDDEQPTFIWVNKYGAHFHYEHAYPAEEQIFTPTMPAGKPIDSCTLEEVENSYANAVRWSVDGFFERLEPALDLDDTVVLYTSDHGQSFKEGAGISTHADRIDPPASQANVPLLAWGHLLEERFPEGVGALREQASHFQLFPTLLVLMGYDESEVARRYGPPLWGDPPDRRIFQSGDLFGRGIGRINDFDGER